MNNEKIEIKWPLCKYYRRGIGPCHVNYTVVKMVSEGAAKKLAEKLRSASVEGKVYRVGPHVVISALNDITDYNEEVYVPARVVEWQIMFIDFPLSNGEFAVYADVIYPPYGLSEEVIRDACVTSGIDVDICFERLVAL